MTSSDAGSSKETMTWLALLFMAPIPIFTILLFVHLRYAILPVVLAEQDRLAKDLQAAVPKTREADAIQQRIDRLTADQHTIQQLVDNRWLWAQKLDQIADLIPPDVQIAALSMEPSTDPHEGPKVTIQGVCAGLCGPGKYSARAISPPLYEELTDVPDWPSGSKEFKTQLNFRPKPSAAKADTQNALKTTSSRKARRQIFIRGKARATQQDAKPK